MNWGAWIRFALGLIAATACARTGLLSPSDDDAVHLDGGRGGSGAGGKPTTGGTTASGGTPANGGSTGHGGARAGGGFLGFGGTPPSGSGVAGTGLTSSSGNGARAGSGGEGGAPGGSGGEAGAPAASCVVRVSSLGSDTSDGSSWASAVASVARALDIAGPGCEVWIAGSATYTPATGAERGATFHLQSGMTLRGGFLGTEQSAAERAFGGPLPVLSGDLGATGDATDNAYHVVTADDDVTLDSVAVSGGRADASADDGGACIHASGALTLEGCVISGCTSSGNGGGILAHGALAITNSTLTLDEAKNFGGALFADGQGPLAIDDALFEDDGALEGGAIYVAGNGARVNVTLDNASLLDDTAAVSGGVIVTEASVSLAVAHSRFEANQAGYGAAILSYGPLSVAYSEFTHNTAAEANGGTVFAEQATSVAHTDFDLNAGGALVAWTQSGACSLAVDGVNFTQNQSAVGAGIAAYSCDVEVAGSRFAGNAASSIGGGVYCDRLSNLDVSASSFEADSAGAYGGAIHAAGPSVHLVDALIARNTCDGEAAAVFAQGDLELTNVTVADNASPGTAAIDARGAILVENSVFWQNTPSDFALETATLSSEGAGTPNLVASNASGTYPNLSLFDPRFVDPQNDDYRLRSDSPCIDHADDSRAPAADMLGRPRVGEADMGAYEYGN